MNRMFFCLLLFIPCALFSQTRFHLGVVKGERATYRCSLLVSEGFAEGVSFPYLWDVRNICNPDTLERERKDESMDTEDLVYPMAKILHGRLAANELQELSENKDEVFIFMRLGEAKNKLSQVTRFLFWRYRAGEDPSKYNGFWLNLSPDRLHELETAIVGELVVPDSFYEFFGTSYDFAVVLFGEDIVDPEKARLRIERERQSYGESRQADTEEAQSEDNP